jgi:hypothetical protein
MGQLGAMLSTALVECGRRLDDLGGVSRGSSTLLDRLLDLLAIFRRPVPVPVKSRRR